MVAAAPAVAAATFLVGVGVIVYSVEALVENVAKASVVTGASTFVLAVVFAGLDFENWAFGVAAVLGDLPGVAIGSALGSGMFLVGVALAGGGLLAPFETGIDRDYLALLVAAPFVLLPTLLDGALSRLDGVALLAANAAILGYIYRAERRGRETFRDEEAAEAEEAVAAEGRGRWYYLGVAALAVVGVVVGSELAVRGARGVVAGFGFDETVFGMTVVGLAMAVEEVTLVVAPVRAGHPSIAVGNVVGSLVFFATGNVGLLAVTRAFTLDPSVVAFYWPAFFAATVLTSGLLYRGRIRRPEGVALGGLYVAFWALSYTVV